MLTESTILNDFIYCICNWFESLLFHSVFARPKRIAHSSLNSINTRITMVFFILLIASIGCLWRMVDYRVVVERIRREKVSEGRPIRDFVHANNLTPYQHYEYVKCSDLRFHRPDARPSWQCYRIRDADSLQKHENWLQLLVPWKVI